MVRTRRFARSSASIPVLSSALAVAFVGLAGCGEMPDADTTGGTPTPPAGSVLADESVMAKVDPDVAAAIVAGTPQDVLVLLDESETEPARAALAPTVEAAGTFGATGTLGAAGTANAVAVASRSEAFARLLDIQKARLFSRLPMPHVTSLATYSHIPVSFVRVSASDALLALAHAPEVVRVTADRPNAIFADENLALVRQPTAAAAGDTGAGTAVAVIDTGTNYKQAAFGCTAPGVPSGCKVIYAADIAPDDGSLDDEGHGTNVAGIVLAMAPATSIIALDVFRGAQAMSSDTISAINWVIANRATYNIVALNLSLGGGSYTAACTTDVFASALNSARAAGIVPVVASGNDGKPKAMASPGCVPAAISVGAVYPSNMGGLQTAVCKDTSSTADKVACFSNSASFLTMLAPGVGITAAGITMSGTSQATPHVAGAVAVLRAAFPSEGAESAINRLISGGVPVKDARNGYTKPRLDLVGALGVSTSVATPAAKPGPVGTIKINAAAKYTKTTTATVTLAAGATATQACISNTTTCETWMPYTASNAWTLASGDGVKTVRAWFKDVAGNVSAAAASATITLDATAPVTGQLVGTTSGTKIVWTWSGFSDATSGIASYKVMTGAASLVAGCASGSAIYSGKALTVTTAAPAAGKTAYYLACAIDAAGNVSTGSQVRVSH